MGIIQIATVRVDASRPWELAAVHIVHAVTPYGVAYKAVLFALAVGLHSLITP